MFAADRRKAEEGSNHPDRDAQFEYPNSTVVSAQGRGQPVISVDRRRRSWSAFKTPGRTIGAKAIRFAGERLRLRGHDARQSGAVWRLQRHRQRGMGERRDNLRTPPNSPSLRSVAGLSAWDDAAHRLRSVCGASIQDARRGVSFNGERLKSSQGWRISWQKLRQRFLSRLKANPKSPLTATQMQMWRPLENLRREVDRLFEDFILVRSGCRSEGRRSASSRSGRQVLGRRSGGGFR